MMLMAAVLFGEQGDGMVSASFWMFVDQRSVSGNSEQFEVLLSVRLALG